MKILYLFSEAPYPPDHGPRHHSFGLLTIAAEQHDCHVFGFYHGTRGMGRWEQLRHILPTLRIQGLFPEHVGLRKMWQKMVAMSTFNPGIVGCYGPNPQVGKALKRVLAEQTYDLIHVDRFVLAGYWKYFENIPSILIPYDAFSMRYARQFRTFQAVFPKLITLYNYLAFSHLEHRIYPRYTVVCPVASVDVDWLRQRIPTLSTQVIEIPVANEFFARATPGRTTTERPCVMCCGWFAADSTARECTGFLRDVLPELKRAIPNLHCIVWGRARSSGMRSQLRQLPDVEHIEWADDYIETLKRAWVYFYPGRSISGIQTKVQQALALGIPVVGYPESLIPLYIQHGRQAFICQSRHDVTEAIVTLLRDANLRWQVGIAAHTHIQTHFSYAAISAKLHRLYHNIAARH